jgi:hypothetical protein
MVHEFLDDEDIIFEICYSMVYEIFLCLIASI